MIKLKWQDLRFLQLPLAGVTATSLLEYVSALHVLILGLKWLDLIRAMHMAHSNTGTASRTGLAHIIN